ncbi:hypothetical protein [Nocardia colli]|uniref:hypothetical protein n=1 Tax=Nocardia colli TaxID=2545717 RepID=UPI0035DB342B
MVEHRTIAPCRTRFAARIAPYAETRFDAQDGAVIVTGHYRGTARATGKPVQAEFAHVWRVDTCPS